MKVDQLHRAIPSERAVAGVLVLHPWWGLSDDTARTRTARVGRVRGRGAGPVRRPGGDDDRGRRPAQHVAERGRRGRDLAAVDVLGESTGDPSLRLGAIGFSMGSAWALWLPVHRPEIVASVTYYGTLDGPSLTRARVPVLGHFAEETSTSRTRAWWHSSSRCGTPVVTSRSTGIREPATGSPSPRATPYDAAAADLAFERTVTFLRRHLVDAG